MGAEPCGFRFSLFIAGVMFLGSTPALMQPSASARMNEPTSSGLIEPGDDARRADDEVQVLFNGEAGSVMGLLQRRSTSSLTDSARELLAVERLAEYLFAFFRRPGRPGTS